MNRWAPVGAMSRWARVGNEQMGWGGLRRLGWAMSRWARNSLLGGWVVAPHA